MKPLIEGDWFAREVLVASKGCCCGSCYDPTGTWEVDCSRVDEGPFVVGTEDEAVCLADFLNALDGTETQ